MFNNKYFFFYQRHLWIKCDDVTCDCGKDVDNKRVLHQLQHYRGDGAHVVQELGCRILFRVWQDRKLHCSLPHVFGSVEQKNYCLLFQILFFCK